MDQSDLQAAMTRTVVITGASSGIGAALAQRYAREGARLGLLGRDRARLSEVAERCRALGAQVETGAVDVTARAELDAWLSDFDARTPVDLLIANAGVLNGLPPGERIELAEASQQIIDINVAGVLNAIHPLLPRMLARRKGTIVINSSVAAFVPLPQMPSYSASKAALLHYGLALRSGLRRQGIRVCVACPGYVVSPMTRQIQGATPFLVTAERAAERIHRGVARNRAVIAFPWPFTTTLRLIGFLPDRVRGMILSVGRFRVLPRE